MFNIGDMFGRLQEMQDQVQKAKNSLNDVIIETEVGGGMVKIKVNANKQVLKLTIDPEIYNDQEMVEDLVCAAVNKAMELAEERAREEMSKVTADYVPNIPGLDLKQFGL
jgi:DNA-binding YbaB/EbfC family protein